MTQKDRQTLAAKILYTIPPNRKPVVFLMDTLGIGKESVYRRLRGEVPFTFDEIIVLSNTLNLSVDTLIGHTMSDQAVFSLQEDPSLTQQTFENMLQLYLSHIHKECRANERQAIISSNKLYTVFHTDKPALFHFFYYKWMHQIHSLPLNLTMSQVKVPQEILKLCEEIVLAKKELKNTIHITHRDFIANNITEILYYYERQLISKEEVYAIYDDLASVVDEVENLTTTGLNKWGEPQEFYISPFDIDSNSAFVHLDGKSSSYFWVYFANPISTSDPSVCSIHKHWLCSLMKYATNITRSNQAMQAVFINTLRKQLELLHV